MIRTQYNSNVFSHSLLTLWPYQINLEEILTKTIKDDEENSLEDTVQTALAQIEKRQYAADLLARGFTLQQIKKYGFAFEGKRAKIGTEYKPQ